jgi:hypothetical protein
MSIPQKQFEILVYSENQALYGRCEYQTITPHTIQLVQKPVEEIRNFYLELFTPILALISFDTNQGNLSSYKIKIHFSSDLLKNEFEELKDLKGSNFNAHIINLGKQEFNVRTLTMNEIENGL